MDLLINPVPQALNPSYNTNSNGEFQAVAQPNTQFDALDVSVNLLHKFHLTLVHLAQNY